MRRAYRSISPEFLPLYYVLAAIGLGAGIVIPLLPVIFSSAGITPTQIGILAVVMSAGAACTAVPAGRWIDRSDTRTVLIAGLVAISVVMNLFPFAHTMLSFGIVRFLEGCCWAVVFVAVEARLARGSTPETRIRNLSYYAVFNGLGFGLGPLLAIVLMPLGIWAPFAGCSLFTLLAALYSTRLSRDAIKPAETVGDRRLLGALYRWILAAFIYGLLETGMTSMLPLVFKVSGYGQAALGITLSSFVLGGVITPLVLSPLVNRLGKAAFVVWAAALASAAALLVPLLPGGVALLMALALLLGASAGVLYVLSLALIGDLVPASKIGIANGFFSSAYSLALVVGPLLSSVLFQYVGARFFLLHVGILGLAYWLLLVLSRSWRLAAPSSAQVPSLPDADIGEPRSLPPT